LVRYAAREIFNLEWNQVDLKEAVIRLKAGDTKSGRPRIIPIASELLKHPPGAS